MNSTWLSQEPERRAPARRVETHPVRAEREFGARGPVRLATRMVWGPRTGVPNGRWLLALLLVLCTGWPLRAAPPLFDKSPRPDLLTPEEKRWLAAHPGIRIAPTDHCEPVEFFDSGGQYWGISAEYFNLIERRLDYQFKIISLTAAQWERPDPAGRGTDVMTASIPTPAQLQYWTFTKP